MKILFIRHHYRGDVNARLPASVYSVEGVFPPIGLAYVAAVVEQAGYDVAILDSHALNLTKEETREAIRKEKPDLVGIPCMTPTLPGVWEAIELVKSVNPEAKIVLGGVHLSVFPKETVAHKDVDFGVYGEGEYTFLELARALEKGGKEKDLGQIRGLIWKKQGQVKLNEIRPPNRDLDDLPYPARHLLPMEKYNAIIMKKPMTLMVASRGCPFNCSYCFKDENIWVYRKRDPKRVVDEMEHCIDEYKVKEIAFSDDCWPDKKYLAAVCNEMLGRGLKIAWETPQRVDLVNSDLLKLMKKSGCMRLRYGVESGSPRILKLMNKGITIDQVKTAFRLTKKVGIENFAYFIVGYPTETRQEFEMSMKLAKEIDPDWVMYCVATPYPNTEMWNLAVKDYGYDPKYWGEWSTGKRNDSLPYFIKEADRWCSQAYQQFYFRPSFVLNKLTKSYTWTNLPSYFLAAYSLLNFKMYDALAKDR